MLPWLLRVWRVLPNPLRLVYLRLRYGRFGIGVSALIRDERGRILLVHRTYSRDEPWSLPGGWLEGKGESIEHALERELREETGLRVKVGPIRAVERAGFAVVLLM
jgi:ADP-ribose pyrophosphatase YjhB (NUDIX family)